MFNLGHPSVTNGDVSSADVQLPLDQFSLPSSCHFYLFPFLSTRLFSFGAAAPVWVASRAYLSNTTAFSLQQRHGVPLDNEELIPDRCPQPNQLN